MAASKRKATSAKRKSSKTGKASAFAPAGLFRLLKGPVGLVVLGVAVLLTGALLGMGLGTLRERGEDTPPAVVAVPSPPPKPVPSAAPEAEGRGYSAADIAALETAIRAAQDTMAQDGETQEAARLPLWDTRADGEWLDPVAEPAPEATPPETTEVAALPVPRVAPPPQLARPPDDGTAPPWLRHAVAVPVPAGRPMIAVVIDDMGIDRRRTRQVIDLKAPLTAAFLSYAPDVAEQARAARAAGMELMVHMPMEPGNPSVDAGPDALTTAMDATAIRDRLLQSLGSFGGYVGVNNHMGSRFTADAAAMRPVMEVLRDQGLLWLDSRTTADTAGPALARELDVPFAERHVFLDHFNTLDDVRAQLARLEDIATRHGHAIGIGHPKDHTITALAAWLPDLAARGFTLVPVSAVVRLRHHGGSATTPHTIGQEEISQ